MAHPVLQSSTQGFYVFADDADSFGEGLAGLAITVELSKSGGSYNTVSPTITDLGGGVYWVAPIAAHRDTLGEIAWRFTADGAVIAPRFERVVAVNDQSAHWGVPAAVLAAAAVSPIHADVVKVNGGDASLDNDVAKESSVQSLLSRITEPVAAMFGWLVAMISPPDGSTGPQWTEESLANATSSGGASMGPGSISHTITIQVSGQPVDGAAVWVSTDSAGTNVIAGTLHTDTHGKVEFMLDAGDYYAWAQKAKVNFTNPSAFTVVAP